MNGNIKDRTLEFIKYKGITMKFFETQCGLSTGYVTSMRKGFGTDKLNNVLKAFPELNRDWLIYGEGEMLRGNVTQTSHGDNSPNIAGNGNNIGGSSALDKALDEIAEQRKLVAKSQEQIDRLLTIVEDMSRRKEAQP